jgi:hypothetical protein
MIEGYDAADPERASTLALRDEWIDEGRSSQVRIANIRSRDTPGSVNCILS